MAEREFVERKGTIQRHLEETDPELLACFREKVGPPPAFIQEAGAEMAECQRCGVPVTDVETHAYWHESVTIGMHAIAMLAAISAAPYG